MVIGVLQFELLIRGCESLKDKRRVVRSLKDRLHREHLVAVAEVGALDDRSRAVMALACIAPDGGRAGEVLDRIDARLRAGIDYELGAVRRNVIRGQDVDDNEPGDAADVISAEMLARMDEPADGDAP
jgi:uncharacterized protein YlxP (DUF503 family)